MGNHKRRDRSPSPESDRRRRKSPRREAEDEGNFSFLNLKRVFHKILLGYNITEQLVDDPADFWLFLAKYETLLRRNMQNVLSMKTDAPETDSVIPSNFDKNYLMNFKLKPSKNQMTATNYDDESKSIDDKKVKIFLTIVRHYLDFKQKERFRKLKKLRKFQKNLPIAPYEKEIVSAVTNESILILAGDTGCGRLKIIFTAAHTLVSCFIPRQEYTSLSISLQCWLR
jgi:hypothetical protein